MKHIDLASTTSSHRIGTTSISPHKAARLQIAYKLGILKPEAAFEDNPEVQDCCISDSRAGLFMFSTGSAPLRPYPPNHREEAKDLKRHGFQDGRLGLNLYCHVQSQGSQFLGLSALLVVAEASLFRSSLLEGRKWLLACSLEVVKAAKWHMNKGPAAPGKSTSTSAINARFCIFWLALSATSVNCNSMELLR